MKREKPGHHDSDSKWQNFELFAAGIAADFRESADACDFLFIRRKHLQVISIGYWLPVLEYFGEGRISAGVYDGDTMPAERSRVRKSANIILTNPEMLNAAFLLNHSKYGFDFIFANLNYIVIDELHSYRGAFGGHLVNIFRRMKRICGYYHSDPQFLCSSATIANPVELAEKMSRNPGADRARWLTGTGKGIQDPAATGDKRSE